MQTSTTNPGPYPEKERLRAEIHDQVEQFLMSGGRIEVVEKSDISNGRPVGSVWSGLFHLEGD